MHLLFAKNDMEGQREGGLGYFGAITTLISFGPEVSWDVFGRVGKEWRKVASVG